MEITDKQRIDFLQSQSFTKWVGYDHKDGSKVMWPVFGDINLREQIDIAMDKNLGGDNNG